MVCPVHACQERDLQGEREEEGVEARVQLFCTELTSEILWINTIILWQLIYNSQPEWVEYLIVDMHCFLGFCRG